MTALCVIKDGRDLIYCVGEMTWMFKKKRS